MQLRGLSVGEKPGVVHVLVGVAVFCEAHVVLAAGARTRELRAAFAFVLGLALDRNQKKAYDYPERTGMGAESSTSACPDLDRTHPKHSRAC